MTTCESQLSPDSTALYTRKQNSSHIHRFITCHLLQWWQYHSRNKLKLPLLLTFPRKGDKHLTSGRTFYRCLVRCRNFWYGRRQQSFRYYITCGSEEYLRRYSVQMSFIADLRKWLRFCAHVQEFHSFIIHILVTSSRVQDIRETLRFTSVS
jgi:hypothetical protein